MFAATQVARASVFAVCVDQNASTKATTGGQGLANGASREGGDDGHDEEGDADRAGADGDEFSEVEEVFGDCAHGAFLSRNGWAPAARMAGARGALLRNE